MTQLDCHPKVLLEHIYNKGNIPVRRYDLRGKCYCEFYSSWPSDLRIAGNREPWLQEVLHLSKQQSIIHDDGSGIPFMHPTASEQHAKNELIKLLAWDLLGGPMPFWVSLLPFTLRTHLMDNIDRCQWHAPSQTASSCPVVTSLFKKLLQLDACTQPRLTVEDFVALFARCHCGMIVTKWAFHMHYCQSAKVEIIDLTEKD